MLILASSVAGWVSILAFVSIVGIFTGIASSAVEIKICAITVVIKSIIREKRKHW